MCNLYSQTRAQDAIRRLFDVKHDRAGNLPSMPGIFPDYSAPVIRMLEGERELTSMRWGMPSPAFALKGKDGKPRKTDPGVTNIRNTKSPHWRRWLGVSNRCLVPFTSFSEFNKAEGGDIWFAFDETRPLSCFAGIFVPNWTSVRKVKEGEVTADLFGFLTTEPNKEVGTIHPKAMPVILTTQDEIETWLTAPAQEALDLQRPLPDGSLKIVGRGTKSDAPDTIQE